MKFASFLPVFAAVVFTFGVLSPSAQAEARFQDGWWRVDLLGAGGVESGAADRKGEIMVNGSVEYEFPLAQRTTLGLRLLPLFVYGQDDDHKSFLGIEYDRESDETVWGGGAGLSLRFYSVKNEYRGLFGEIEGLVLGHGEEFEGNSSNVNFLTGAGLGYKFENNLSLVVKFNHISNAGLGEHNRGINTVGLGLGYSF